MQSDFVKILKIKRRERIKDEEKNSSTEQIIRMASCTRNDAIYDTV